MTISRAKRVGRSGVLAVVAGLAMGAPALAGGSAENVVLIINPGSAESMYLGNYYKNARNIPDSNVVYLEAEGQYTDFAGANGACDGFFGGISNARIGDHADYAVVSNTGTFFTAAAGLVTDQCFQVTRFGEASIYSMAYIRAQVLAGNVPSGLPNQYYSGNPGAPRAFSSSTFWLSGSPSTPSAGKRYVIPASLGYTGDNGNTLAELLAMIDRSVAADQSHPAGTFYFMSTADSVRNVRAPQFPATEANIISHGGAAITISGDLPDGHNDCLGVLTGVSDPDVAGSTMQLVPGAFCDHLTSYAAAFDINSQVKLSAWIRKGASGSAGEVEEPCNYTGKFPNADLHAFYFQGMSLGESYFRSLQYVPFQGYFVGDPLTRPFATLPTVSVGSPGTVSGDYVFTPMVATSLPGAAIATYDVMIDGRLHSSHPPGEATTIHTSALPDGWHEIRVLAHDNTAVASTGRAITSMTTSNFGHTATLNLTSTTGDLNTLFHCNAGASGGTVREIRLLQNGRVLAAAAGPGDLQVYGRNLGGGISRVQTEVTYADGSTARSAPVSVNVSYTVSTPSGLAPVAYSYTKHVQRGGPFVVELPARFDDVLSGTTYALVSPPAQSTVGPTTTRGYRVMTAGVNACGSDQFTFRVTTASGQSNIATVTLVYDSDVACIADISGDGHTNVNDFIAFQGFFAAGDLRADVNHDCRLNVNDFVSFTQIFVGGCP